MSSHARSSANEFTHTTPTAFVFLKAKEDKSGIYATFSVDGWSGPEIPSDEDAQHAFEDYTNDCKYMMNKFLRDKHFNGLDDIMTQSQSRLTQLQDSHQERQAAGGVFGRESLKGIDLRIMAVDSEATKGTLEAILAHSATSNQKGGPYGIIAVGTTPKTSSSWDNGRSQASSLLHEAASKFSANYPQGTAFPKNKDLTKFENNTGCIIMQVPEKALSLPMFEDGQSIAESSFGNYSLEDDRAPLL
ncbi:uncharacterized protein L201_005634 [Kwoniella dendrophila CBS 6074]|uniref:Uncharacterized protein n=1 Tax=Kwoniella dendrophila CBS 6074 TaxID=1295534 RepID=A0AAX4JZJ7_9TREE